jgi:hypothetical protein
MIISERNLLQNDLERARASPQHFITVIKPAARRLPNAFVLAHSTDRIARIHRALLPVVAVSRRPDAGM